MFVLSLVEILLEVNDGVPAIDGVVLSVSGNPQLTLTLIPPTVERTPAVDT